MDDSVVRFYDDLAAEYHLIFADWRASARHQGQVLDRLIRQARGAPPLSVLDCSCGIGTQALGLALRGYRVHGTDVSRASVERARQEAAAFDVTPTFAVADLRTLEQDVTGRFDVVLSCDNAIPHLLTDEELRRAARGMYAKLAAEGLLLVSIRDYDRILGERPRATTPDVHGGPDGRRVVFQVWEWTPAAPTYTVHHFILREAGSDWRVTHRTTAYRALRQDEWGGFLREAGFADVRWRAPEETGYYQPIVTARKR